MVRQVVLEILYLADFGRFGRILQPRTKMRLYNEAFYLPQNIRNTWYNFYNVHLSCNLIYVRSATCHHRPINTTETIMDNLSDRDPNIVFLSETWLKTNKNHVTATCGYILLHDRRKDRDKELDGGVGILLKLGIQKN